MTITSFTLVDAITDEDLMELADGDTIDITQTFTDRFNIRANVIPDTIGSIVFDLNGSITDENEAPYALLGNIGPDYRGEQFALSAYTLVATPYTGLNGSGVAGVPQIVQFDIVENPTKVIGLGLYDATTDQLLGPLSDGDVLDLSQIGSDLSIKAITSPDSVGSVQFRLLGDANEVSLDNTIPYVFPGDNQAGDFSAYAFAPGSYQAKATSWKHPNGKGMRGREYTANFTVISSARAARPDFQSANSLTLYPNPTNGKLIVNWKGNDKNPISLEIYSLVGQKVWNQQVQQVDGNWSETINLESLPSGTYVLKFTQGSYQTNQFFQRN
ncbi:MAG: T9SS type A sorting domain-containing protein [Bacteroidota bacterium]